MNLTVHSVQRITGDKPLNVPIHTHHSYELVLYTCGQGTVDIEDQTYAYTSGTIMIVPPDTPHNEINYEGRSNLIINFSADCEIPCGYFHAEKSTVLIVENMLYETAKRQSLYTEMLNLQLQQVMILLIRQMRDRTEKEQDSFGHLLANIDYYIEENLSQPISIDDFARLYNYSSSRFRHLFTERVNVSPKQYIIAKRLNKAKALLEETDKTITEIAYECGFYDSAQFSRIFKKEYHMSPLKFRKAQFVHQ